MVSQKCSEKWPLENSGRFLGNHSGWGNLQQRSRFERFHYFFSGNVLEFSKMLPYIVSEHLKDTEHHLKHW